MNQGDVSMLAGIIAALPLTLADNSTYKSAIKSAAAEGTCETTRPGGCLGNQFGKQNGKLDDLIRSADLGLQAAQLAALQRLEALTKIIDRKLGAEIPAFGIGGKLTNFLTLLALEVRGFLVHSPTLTEQDCSNESQRIKLPKL